MIRTNKKFSKHIFLNDGKTSYMGNLKMFFGKAHWNKGKEKQKEILFALSDCHSVARIHAKNDSEKEIKKFILKLRKIADGASEFADYLERRVAKKCIEDTVVEKGLINE